MAGDSKGEIYPDGAEGETRSARRPTPGRGPADAASAAATHALRATLTIRGEGKPWSCDALGVSTPEVLKAPHRTFFGLCQSADSTLLLSVNNNASL